MGSIEVICGGMFSGKTEELLRRMKRARIAKLQTDLFKPDIDTRYDDSRVVSHNNQKGAATPVGTAKEILEMIDYRVEVVGIDEAQFFDESLIEICNQLADRGVRVILAGLDMDFAGRPFGPMPHLLAIADAVTKLHAICTQCGDDACRSYRLSNQKDVVAIGANDTYEARCRRCASQS